MIWTWVGTGISRVATSEVGRQVISNAAKELAKSAVQSSVKHVIIKGVAVKATKLTPP